MTDKCKIVVIISLVLSVVLFLIYHERFNFSLKFVHVDWASKFSQHYRNSITKNSISTKAPSSKFSHCSINITKNYFSTKVPFLTFSQYYRNNMTKNSTSTKAPFERYLLKNFPGIQTCDPPVNDWDLPRHTVDHSIFNCDKPTPNTSGMTVLPPNRVRLAQNGIHLELWWRAKLY